MHIPRLLARTALASALTVALTLSGCDSSSDQDTAGTTGDSASTDISPQPTGTGAGNEVVVGNVGARRFVDAVNSGNTDQVMATLTDDATVMDSGRRFADAKSIRDWLEAEVTGIDGQITVRSEQPAADGTELRVDFRSSGFTGTNLRYRFTTRDDLITNLTLG